MSINSRARQAVVAAAVAATVAAAGAAAAEAKTVTVTDDTAADFTLSAQSDTDTVVRADGTVEIAPNLEEAFNGPALPAGWTPTLWDPLGTATADGALKLNGAQLVGGATAGPGSSLEFVGTFADVANEHVGFATDFNSPPWAIFSTGGGNLPLGFYARTSDGSGALDDIDTPVAVTAGEHKFRIDWSATGFVFFVDDVQVASHAIPNAAPMTAAGSDFNVDTNQVTVDSATLRARTTAKFTSRALDAGDARVTGLSLTPAGTGAISYETRTADSAAGLDAASWAALSGSAVASPKRFLQYRATLTTSNPVATPRLDKIDAAFTVDDEAPKVTIQGVAVAGRAAKATFSSDDAAADVKCSLDGAAFAACSSPVEFTGLAYGAHKIDVKATDEVGNVGTASRSFEVAAPPADPGTPPASGTGNTPRSSGPAADLTAPKVLVTGTAARVSKRGVAKLRIRCPRSEQSCVVAVTLKLRGKRVASTSLTLSRGNTQTFRLRLSAAARRKLADSSRLSGSAVIVAKDAAGNQAKTKHRVTLIAPAG